MEQWVRAVCKANEAHKVLLVLRVLWVLREQMENRARKVNQDLKAFAERWAHKVFRVCRVYQDLKDSEAKQDRLDLKESKASAESAASVDCKAYTASVDFKVLLDPKVSEVEMAKEVHQELVYAH